MKVKKKGGKVFPSPPSSSSCSSSSSPMNGGGGGGEGDVLSVLKLLPLAIIAIVSILCFEDREVLAYMITRSINNAPNLSSSSILPKNSAKKSNHKNKSKNNHISGCGGVKGHKPPIFECDCFDCYANYWHRWNSSPNRDLIQEAIEAFEEHLSTHEKSSRKSTKSGKQRRVKANRRNVEKPLLMSPLHETDKPTSPTPSDNVSSPMTSSKAVATGSASVMEENSVFVRSPGSTHKCFARKVLPDLFGLLNSRLRMFGIRMLDLLD